MAFHEGSFKQRFGFMGDRAEGVFEQVFKGGLATYGLRRPPLNLSKVPMKIRYTPDFITSFGLVEAMGCGGRDSTIKLKCEKFEALLEWHSDWKVELFVFDSSLMRHTTVGLDELSKIIVTGKAEKGEFSEGKAYWAIPSALLEGWTDYVEPADGI